VRTPFPLSLEQKLPLVFSGLLLAIIVVLTTVAYSEVRDASWASVRARLPSVARELAQNSALGHDDRLSALRRAASSAHVRAAVLARLTADSTRALDSVRALLTAMQLPSATVAITLPSERPSGNLDRDALGTLLRDPEMQTTGAQGHLYASGDSVASWIAVPVRVDGSTAAYLAIRRVLRSPPLAVQRLRAVSGFPVTTYFADSGLTFWGQLDGGRPTAPPRATFGSDSLWHYQREGEPYVAAQAQIRGTPNILIAEQPVAAVLERPNAFLRAIALSAIALLALSAAAAWFLSRRMTHPLAALTRAADAMAAGDYAHRVKVATHDEIGHTAAAFNAMAQRIEEASAELRQQFEASRTLAKELDQANRAKADFLAVVSHELRTPLNAIAGYVDLMELGLRGPLSEEQRHDLARIRRNQHHLMGIITSILNFARIDAREMPYEMQAVPLRAALREVAALIEPQVRSKGLTYEFVPCADDIIAWADAQGLEQIVLNLLSNAIRFTPAGGRITLSCGGEGQRAWVRVSDSGIGIPAGKMERIFDPFVQGESGLTRRAEGTGLGLAISRGLARGMGGEISVTSEEGVGSAFTLSLGIAPPGAIPTTASLPIAETTGARSR
jgi:signal transduction histidine kinase